MLNSNVVRIGNSVPCTGSATSSRRLISPAEFNNAQTSLILPRYASSLVSPITDYHLMVAFMFMAVKKE
jgi:hypothetical protein